jgi:hypothetical protein
MTTCTGFVWIGQDFAHCDNCGRDIREHDGLDWRKPGTPPFGTEREIIPFDEARKTIPLFAHQVTPLNSPDGPYRYEREPEPEPPRPEPVPFCDAKEGDEAYTYEHVDRAMIADYGWVTDLEYFEDRWGSLKLTRKRWLLVEVDEIELPDPCPPEED